MVTSPETFEASTQVPAFRELMTPDTAYFFDADHLHSSSRGLPEGLRQILLGTVMDDPEPIAQPSTTAGSFACCVPDEQGPSAVRIQKLSRSICVARDRMTLSDP